MDWVLIAQPHISSGFGTVVVNLEWMGAFTHKSDMCNKLHMAGVPVWYVCTMAYIPANMKVHKPVLITHPNDIIISMYTEGNRIRPYDIIHHGQGGHQHQLHVCHLYSGTTFRNPDIAVPPSASSSSFSTPSSSALAPSSRTSAAGRAPKQNHKKHRRQPYAKEAQPTQPSQSGESRDKWKDPESPYLLPSLLHWDDALKTCNKDPSRMHMPYAIDRGYRFPEPALLLSPKLPEHLQGYIATWLACHLLWIGRVDHDPPCNYPSPQLWCDFLGSGLTTQSQGAAPKVSVASLTNPPRRLTQRITWELFELGFCYELRDLNRYLAHKRWADDLIGHEQLLDSIFPGEAGLVMWSEQFPEDNYGMWNNTLIGVLPYLEKFCELICAWDNAPPLLVAPLTPDSFTDTKCWEVMHTVTAFYVQTFFCHFGRPPIVPHFIPL
ncbi:hypothetical protein EDB19DRAFT_1916995 [Suillus lakei]|nr:hypothetical protein EDB19DRAFT_1916995 [Suillus lakei]